jgi:hypothetical protein
MRIIFLLPPLAGGVTGGVGPAGGGVGASPAGGIGDGAGSGLGGGAGAAGAGGVWVGVSVGFIVIPQLDRYILARNTKAYKKRMLLYLKWNSL